MTKHTELEIIKREIIKRRTKKGQSIQTIKNWLMEAHDYSQPGAYRIISEARKDLEEEFNSYYKDRLKDQVLLLESMAEEAIEAKDRRGALEVIKEINKLSGLYTEKIDVTSGGEPLTIKILVDGDSSKAD